MKLKKRFGKSFGAEFSSSTEPAQLVVLAKEAFEIAAREKDRSGSGWRCLALIILGLTFLIAAQDGLFSKMEDSMRNRNIIAASAESPFSAASVDTAFMGTKCAMDFVN